jgi:tetratricopeptide (TPR) repeat protein
LGQYGFAAVDLRQAVRLKPDYTEASDILKLAQEKLGPASAPGTVETASVAAASTTDPAPANPDAKPASITPDQVPLSAPKSLAQEPPAQAQTPVVIAQTATKSIEPQQVGVSAPKPLAPETPAQAKVRVAMTGPNAKPVVAAPEKPMTAGGHNRKGRELMKEGNYPAALTELSEAIRMKPDFAPAYNARGFLCILTKRYPEAIRDLDAAIRIDPIYVNAYQNRAAVRKLAGDSAGAIQDLERVNKLAAK